jgi:triphosphoribosyl-dephospho-CoA synthase
MFAESIKPEQSIDHASRATLTPEKIGRLAIVALYREVALAPKPGLVNPMDSGSHTDMDFSTFVRSLQALRGYFPAISRLGMQTPTYAQLQCCGVDAEQRMLQATNGINTHRGAIFNLGLLCAAAGADIALAGSCSAESVSRRVADLWGPAIVASAKPGNDSHGAVVQRRYGSGGARTEAAAGFPSAISIGLPAYRAALAQTHCPQQAAVQCFFALMAELEDTNLLWRGGHPGLDFARKAATTFLARGGVYAPDWQNHAQALHAKFVSRRLSPGGSADLLGVVLFLESL